MIYITGDTHGEIDIQKLNGAKFKEQKYMLKQDYVLIAGDFGFVWKENKTQEYWLKWISSKNFTSLFIDGNHENFDLLNKYPTEIWNGGKVHRINDSIIHLMRGQVFNLTNRKIFTFGGGNSIDKEYRVDGISWWKEEMPSNEEYQEGIRNLDKNNWMIDYIITHTAPSNIVKRLSNKIIDDELSKYLQEITEKTQFKKWYFGHYHVDKIIENKYYALYQQKLLLQ
jgi:hypothetical protein